ncbi:MAG: PAS domain S-box protein [Methanomicrobiales archaeon]|nr:PAS domain S-box protein [Methanomicrobiales archaeon]
MDTINNHQFILQLIMEEDQDVPGLIQKLIRSSPRGLTISDISKKINKNRNITAKYLDILKAEGKVDARQVGSARVYWLSQRVPLSAFLCFTKNMIVIVDMDLNVVQANNQYLTMAGLLKEEIIGMNILEETLPVISIPETIDIIRSVKKDQVITDVRYVGDGAEYYYKMEVIPTLFDEENKGLTIVLEDITEQKQHDNNIEFLARSAIDLVDLPPDADIYEYVSERVIELLPGNLRFIVESYDPVSKKMLLKTVQGCGFREDIRSLLGYDVVGLHFPIEESFSAAPFHETPLTIRAMREMHFRPFFEDEEVSLYDFCARMIPEEDCNKILLRCNLAKIYLTGLVWQDRLYGIVGIFLGKDESLRNKQVIESLLRQASIAIARRQTEEKLLCSKRRIHEYLTVVPVPAMCIDNSNRILQINPVFTKEYGYTNDECGNFEEWIQKAVIDPECQKVVNTIIMPDSGNNVIIKPDVVPLQCLDQTEKTVRIKTVQLSDGMRTLFWEPA